MLTPAQSFAYGFFLKCAELGLSAEQTERVVQAAGEGLHKVAFIQDGVNAAKAVFSAAAPAIQQASPYLLAAGIGIPAAAGYGVGRALGSADDFDDEDIESLKTQELIDAYERAAQRLASGSGQVIRRKRSR